MINVVIISNHPARDFGGLSAQQDMQISKVLPTSVDNIVEQIGNNGPDIIVIADSIYATSKNKLCYFLTQHFDKTKVLVLTSTGEQPTYEMLARSGFKARGYVPPEQQSKLAKAIRVVFKGESWLPRRLVSDMLNRYTGTPFNQTANLSI